MADKPAAWPRLGDDPSKIGSPNWLEFEIAFQQLGEDALDDLNALLRSWRCAFRLVYPNGKEICGPADARQMELRVEMDANGVDHIVVYPSGYRPPINSGEPDYLDGRVTFFALAKDIEQLRPTATAAPPKSSATPKKRKQRSGLPRKRAEEAIRAIWGPAGPPGDLDNKPLCTDVGEWLKAHDKPTPHPDTILRAAGRRED